MALFPFFKGREFLCLTNFMKKTNYYFSNIECDFYPCHEYSKTRQFNCLFCYCPLYNLKKCLGNPKYILNDKGQKIRSCSDCIFPHIPENYDKIVSYLMNQNEILNIELLELKKNMNFRLAKISGFENMGLEMRQEHETIAEYIYESYLKDAEIEVLLQPFSKKCVREQGFHFNDDVEIRCDILERLGLEQEDIILGYFYTFHAPEFSRELEEKYERLPLLEQYYVENWLIAVLDAGREWIRNYLFRKNSIRHSCYVTDSFGPGFYGMTIEALPQFFKIIDSKSVGVMLTESGNLNPLKSCIGIYLVTKKDVSHLMGHDCVNCAGNKFGCNACRDSK